ncbi:unnamed protein product [Schistocephalus solidus]|uniref:DUF7083 domain-containing protein n=1 Tax=Schistocephalus solidus TaxID=70667 RepID=A0A183TJK2_SCHSO|nr:unnamed protein product [Schistocephalus solidus]
MVISAEQLMSILQQQQAQFEAAHLTMMESMMQQFSQYFPDPESSGKQYTSADAVAACRTEFIYNPDSSVTFNAWFKCLEDIIRVEFAKFDDAWKVHLSLRKLGNNQHEPYTDMLLPKNPREFIFDETVKHFFRDLW